VPPWAELAEGVSRLEHWLLPAECLLCRRPSGGLRSDPLICAPCRARWSPLPHPQCSRCGQPLVPDIACRLCATWPAEFGRVVSAVWLDGPAREAVHLLKYDGWWRVASELAETMRRAWPGLPNPTQVPIPLGATRLRSRGYNQSAALAAALGRALGVPVSEGALRRRRETRTQTALTPEERAANLAGAFVGSGPALELPVLVDDVFTTGATLAEAARALLAQGAPAVAGITFARAPRPLAEAMAAPERERIKLFWRRA
jgi:ComF family protein